MQPDGLLRRPRPARPRRTGASLPRIQAVARATSTAPQDLVLRRLQAGLRFRLGTHCECLHVDADERPVQRQDRAGRGGHGRGGCEEADG